jgi:hypothetical protein
MNPEDAQFTKMVIEVLPKQLEKLYLSHVKMFNYGFVGGCGVIINTLLLYFFSSMFPLFIANWVAIGIAWSWNYMLSVGPLGFIFGLNDKGEKK